MKEIFAWTILIASILVGCGNDPNMSPMNSNSKIVYTKSAPIIYTVSWNNTIYSITQEEVTPTIIGKPLFVLKDQRIYTPQPITNGQIGANIGERTSMPAPAFLGASPALYQIKGVDTSQAIALGTIHGGRYNYVKCVYASPLK